MEQVTCRAVGDSALLAEFAEVISLEENRKVRALKAAIEQKGLPGVGEAIPAYRSLLIRYDPCRISFARLREAVEACVQSLADVELPPALLVEIPVCYEGEYAMDMEEITRLEGKSAEQIIRIHTEEDNFIYMLGFTPGQPYGARQHAPFSFGRRSTPRVRVPAGSVVVQRELTDILPFDQPCGWRIIGRTPVKLFDPGREEPFLLRSGQWFRHIPISASEFARIRQQVERGSYACRTVVKEVLP